MTFELQHSNIPQAKLLDADPVTTDWPLPPVKRWEPCSGFDLDAMCQEARLRLAKAVHIDAGLHRLEMRAGHRFGIAAQWAFRSMLADEFDAM